MPPSPVSRSRSCLRAVAAHGADSPARAPLPACCLAAPSSPRRHSSHRAARRSRSRAPCADRAAGDTGFPAAQPEVAALTHPRNALLLRPVVPREIPQRSVRTQRIQALPSARKANRLVHRSPRARARAARRIPAAPTRRPRPSRSDSTVRQGSPPPRPCTAPRRAPATPLPAGSRQTRTRRPRCGSRASRPPPARSASHPGARRCTASSRSGARPTRSDTPAPDSPP